MADMPILTMKYPESDYKTKGLCYEGYATRGASNPYQVLKLQMAAMTAGHSSATSRKSSLNTPDTSTAYASHARISWFWPS